MRPSMELLQSHEEQMELLKQASALLHSHAASASPGDASALLQSHDQKMQLLRKAADLLQSYSRGPEGAAGAKGPPLRLGRGQEPLAVDDLMGKLRQALTEGGDADAPAAAAAGTAVAAAAADADADDSLRPGTPDAISPEPQAPAVRRAPGGGRCGAAGESDPPPATRTVRLQAGGVATRCLGVAPGGRQRRLAMKARMDKNALQGLDPREYCRTVKLQSGGEQQMSYGLGPGERKGDYARARLFSQQQKAAA